MAHRHPSCASPEAMRPGRLLHHPFGRIVQSRSHPGTRVPLVCQPDRRQCMTHQQRGFSLVEMLAVIVIVGMMASIALPKSGIASYKANGAAQTVASALTYAQRQAISMQTDIRVAFDAGNNELRIHEDANNDNVIDL